MSTEDIDRLLRDARLQLEFEERVRGPTDALRALTARVLDVLDGMTRAEAAGGPEVVGVLRRQLRAALTDSNVELIGSVGDAFDPRIHTAVEVRPGEPATVLEILRHGCRHAGALIRPASVVVGQTPPGDNHE